MSTEDKLTQELKSGKTEELKNCPFLRFSGLKDSFSLFKISLAFLMLSSGLEMVELVSSQARSAEEYAASGLRDPFESQLPKAPLPGQRDIEPISEEQIQAPAITVQSQISGGPTPQAIIEGKILRVGNKVQEAIITKITKEGVEVFYRGQTFSYPAPSRTLKPAQIEGGKNDE